MFQHFTHIILCRSVPDRLNLRYMMYKVLIQAPYFDHIFR